MKNHTYAWLSIPRHVRALAIALVVVTTFAVSAGCGGGSGTDPKLEPLPPLQIASVAEGSALRVFQVDFADGQERVRDTAWGRLYVDPAELEKTTGIQGGWLNVATEAGWVVVNLPLPPPGEPPFAVYFDLGMEQPRPLKRIQAVVRHSNHALDEIEGEMGQPADYHVSDWVIDHRGYGPGRRLDPGLPPPALAVLEHILPPRESNGWYQMSTNEQCATNQCATMATANALQYLENMGVITIPHVHDLGLRGDTTLVGVLDEYAHRLVVSRSSGDGSTLRLIVDGAFEYFADEGLTGLLGHRHQDEGSFASGMPAADHSSRGSTTHYDGGMPTFDWIYDRMGEGCGVVAGFSHASGGHAVRITAAFEDDTGNQWVRYAHDALQTHSDMSDTRGLENVVVQFVDLDLDGIPNFGAHSRELHMVWAHCP